MKRIYRVPTQQPPARDFLPGASFLNIVGLAKHLGAWWPVLGLVWLVVLLVRPVSPRAK